jgi:hypothetical protein
VVIDWHLNQLTPIEETKMFMLTKHNSKIDIAIAVAITIVMILLFAAPSSAAAPTNPNAFFAYRQGEWESASTVVLQGIDAHQAFRYEEQHSSADARQALEAFRQSERESAGPSVNAANETLAFRRDEWASSSASKVSPYLQYRMGEWYGN